MTVGVHNDVVLAPQAPVVGVLGQFAVLATVAAAVGLGPLGWLAGIGYAVVTWLLLSRALRQPGASRWGPANTVTLARVTLIGGVTALAADSLGQPAQVPVLVALATVALLLDGVDGQVARRTGTTSALGARFDMEADSVLVLVLCVFVAPALGWWVLAIGLFRYAFAAAAWALPWLQAPLSPRWSRKAVAATQGIVLVVASAGVVPGPVMTVTVGLSLALLGWSFGTDVRRLWWSSRVAVAGHSGGDPRSVSRGPR